jgi:hypothetical protein
MQTHSPVGLKEAGLDSPTFRATVHHFGEQIDVVEKWLENYIKAASRVANEVTSLEALINTYLSWATPPQAISEAVLDHDYTLLALKRYNEGAKEFWMATIKWMKKVESTVIDPIRSFLQTDVANLKVQSGLRFLFRLPLTITLECSTKSGAPAKDV